MRTLWLQPASVTKGKQERPSLTTSADGASLRLAKSAISAPVKPSTT